MLDHQAKDKLSMLLMHTLVSLDDIDGIVPGDFQRRGEYDAEVEESWEFFFKNAKELTEYLNQIV